MCDCDDSPTLVVRFDTEFKHLPRKALELEKDFVECLPRSTNCSGPSGQQMAI